MCTPIDRTVILPVQDEESSPIGRRHHHAPQAGVLRQRRGYFPYVITAALGGFVRNRMGMFASDRPDAIADARCGSRRLSRAGSRLANRATAIA